MSMFIDSVCPTCSGVNQVVHSGEKILTVHCKHCPKPHVYDHIVHPVSTLAKEDEKIQKVHEMIVKKGFAQLSERSIICLIILDNGYEVEGKSTVKDKKDFNEIIGKDVAYEKALKRAVLALGAILD